MSLKIMVTIIESRNLEILGLKVENQFSNTVDRFCRAIIYKIRNRFPTRESSGGNLIKNEKNVC